MPFFLYMLVGCIIAIPYTFLAGGDGHNFFLTAIVAPIPALLLTALLYDPDSDRGRGLFQKAPTRSWYLWATYLCMPIILNGVSIGTHALGYYVASEWIHVCRYHSVWFIPATLLTGFIIYGNVESLFSRIRINGRTPPSEGPPSNSLPTAYSQNGGEVNDRPDHFQLVLA